MAKQKIYYIIGGLLALLVACFLFCGRSTDSGSSINNILDRIDGITDDNRRAGQAINSASTEVSGVTDELGSVSGELGNISSGIGQSAATAHNITTEIGDSQSIVSRCIELNRNAKSILNDIEQGNQSGTQASKN